MNENEKWYVRAMIHRGFCALEESIEDTKALLERGDANVPATIRQSLENMNAYQEQMLDEARKYIPADLQ